jgi:hypothetical protein
MLSVYALHDRIFLRLIVWLRSLLFRGEAPVLPCLPGFARGIAGKSARALQLSVFSVVWCYILSL